MGRALMVRVGVGRTFRKRTTNLDRISSAWPVLRVVDPTAAPQLLLDTLHKTVYRTDLALLLRHPEDGVYCVEATSGYPGKDLSWVQFTQDSPLIRHLVAHPVTTRHDQLVMLPWFNFLPGPEREAMAELGPTVIEPLSSEKGLAGFLVLAQRRSRHNNRYLGTDRSRWRWAGLSAADRVRLASIIEGWWVNQRGWTAQPPPGLALPLPRELDQATHIEQTARGVAHDLNNILTTIISHAQLLEQEPKGADIKSHAAAIRQAGLDGAASVLRMGRLPDRPAELEFHKIEVNEIIRSTLYTIEPRWRQGRISYLSGAPLRAQLQTAMGATDAHTRPAGPAPVLQVTLRPAGHVWASPTELRRVLTNLLTNAVESLPQQNGSIEVTSCRDGGQAVIKVNDNGAGISPEIRGRIFEPYFTTKGRRGRGLGLSISQGILSRHGGQLEVESKEGCGSTFTILLPQAELEESPQ